MPCPVRLPDDRPHRTRATSPPRRDHRSRQAGVTKPYRSVGSFEPGDGRDCLPDALRRRARLIRRRPRPGSPTEAAHVSRPASPRRSARRVRASSAGRVRQSAGTYRPAPPSSGTLRSCSARRTESGRVERRAIERCVRIERKRPAGALYRGGDDGLLDLGAENPSDPSASAATSKRAGSRRVGPGAGEDVAAAAAVAGRRRDLVRCVLAHHLGRQLWTVAVATRKTREACSCIDVSRVPMRRFETPPSALLDRPQAKAFSI